MYTIQMLANELGVATQTIRRWEAVELIPPVRRVNGQRRWNFAEAQRVKDIVSSNTGASINSGRPRKVTVTAS